MANVVTPQGPSVPLDVDAVCLGCGCTDSEACPGGCSWLFVDRWQRIGLCSSCEHTVRGKQLRAQLFAVTSRLLSSARA